ncbi:hypothetical protein [Geobacillus sp. BK01]|uniref:hypothetical protein n=1 Tax=Geobacillus sp. BK01 TaxID=3457328 RepID=UPI003FA58162
MYEMVWRPDRSAPAFALIIMARVGKAGGGFHIYFTISGVNGKKEDPDFMTGQRCEGASLAAGASNAKSGSLSDGNRFDAFCRQFLLVTSSVRVAYFFRSRPVFERRDFLASPSFQGCSSFLLFFVHCDDLLAMLVRWMTG